MAILMLGLIIFLGAHSVRIVAPTFRDRQMATIGRGRWRGGYGIHTSRSIAGIVISTS